MHSEYSLLDGLARLPELCKYAKASGMPAIALTDHGQMYGTIKFHRAATAAGIKPIFGAEVYQAPRRLHLKEGKRDSKPFHLVLLAKNKIGYRNLLKLVSVANLEGFYYRPRIDRELLAEHAEGLICLSACVSGQVPRLLAEGQIDEARDTVRWFKELFGPENYYLELQRHGGVPQLEQLNEQMVALAKQEGLHCVATNDVHYTRREDAKTHELLLAMQTQTTMSDPNRMRMGSDDYYLMTPDEMAAHMPEYPEARENTLRVAELCNLDLSPDGYHLPIFDVPAPHTAEDYLRALCVKGLEDRYDPITPEVTARLEHELKVIHDMGFDDYFLINHDLVTWCKDEAKMLIGPGRGSGASSIVAYALGITDLEPLELGLIFERFLNPGRVTMPDIDLDYPEDRRQEVIEYLTQRYGQDHTSQIATFGTMAARGAIRDVGRALGIPLDEVDYVAKLIPFGPGKTIQDGLDEVAELKDMYDTQSHIKRLIDYARSVQGISRHFSTHAAGVLVSDLPLVEYTPLQRAPKSDGVVSQYCMEDVEEIGLLKLDVLGLSTLTVLDRAFKWIMCTRNLEVTQKSISMRDPDTYALLSSGEVHGIFQVESEGMRRILRDMQPTEFREIVAVLALYRPGPMQFIPKYIDCKFGRQDIEYRHPSLQPILEETYGIVVYQEQIIRIATELAGYSAAEADLMRRAVGKKKEKALKEQHAKFVEGAVAGGIPSESAEGIFDDILEFANYGFNKSHSAAYAVITVQTAYLKSHHPVEFMTALLSVDRGNSDKAPGHIAECRRLGIDVRGPDINLSDVDFVIEPSACSCLSERDAILDEQELAIRFGLGAIKNVGDGPAQVIVDARAGQPFVDIDDFVDRVDLRQVNKRVLECMIRAGALDCLGERNRLLASLDQMLATSQQAHRAKEIGQTSLFDLNPSVMGEAQGAKFELARDTRPMPEKKRLADEKELLGVYVSSHPLQVLNQYVDDRLTALDQIDIAMAGDNVTVAGSLVSMREITTKKGDPMAFAQLEDLGGSMELVIFPNTYRDSQQHLKIDSILMIKAKVDSRDDTAKLIADSIVPYAIPANAPKRQPQGNARRAKHILLEIPLTQDPRRAAELADQVVSLLANNQGDTPFSICLVDRRGRIDMSFPKAATMLTPALEQEITSLIGQDHLRVSWA